jgi:phenylacetate-CoA ligase
MTEIPHRGTPHYDALETYSADERAAAMAAALPAIVAHAQRSTAYFGAVLKGVDAATVATREALSKLPVTRKSDLVNLQAASLPFAGMLAVPIGQLARVFVSPGPINDAEGRGRDYWGTARAFYAAGFRAGDLVHNTFSYHLTPAGSMFETGLHVLGAAVIPAGVGQTEQQLAAIAALKPNGYVGTPSFLKILLEKAVVAGQPITTFQRALVSGEAFLPAHREHLASVGIDAYQAYGTADVGIVAYETSARQGLVTTEHALIEIVRPGTGDPVADGEVGEVLVTQLSANHAYPLIRFATGDLSAVLPGPSPCGRTAMRIKGWMGRADQTTKVRGMFVHPHQVAGVVKRHPEILRARLVVSHVNGEDAMELRCALLSSPPAGLADAVVASLRDITKLRGDVVWVDTVALPNDGKVIDDTRKFG